MKSRGGIVTKDLPLLGIFFAIAILLVISPTNAATWTSINGRVLTQTGTPVCAMVLANGQHMFSCDGAGNYDLYVPLDNSGLITLQVFASGFAPFKQSLTAGQAIEYDVYMDRDTSGRAFTLTHDELASSRQGWVVVSGNINHNGTPLCALILINGQSMFSCNQNLGRYSLAVPVDNNGNIVLQAFVAGFQPYRETFPIQIEQPLNAKPVFVADLTSVIAAATGWQHSCAVDDTGQAWCWGENEWGQLGCPDDMDTIPYSGIPYTDIPCAVISVTPPMTLAVIATDRTETCGLDLSGSAICWGYGIPLNPPLAPIGPTRIDTSELFTILESPMSDLGMCGLTEIGTRYCWGQGATVAERLIPALQGDSGLRFVEIGLGETWGCGVTADDEAWCWGSNWYGQLGIGTVGQFEGPLESQVPVKVVGNRAYVAITAGASHACALDSDGAAWCWGAIPEDHSYGTPQPVPGDHRFDKIFNGGRFSCGITRNGEAWCWGSGPFGILGNGNYDDSLEPVPVAGGLYFSTLATGGTHTCGITMDQRLYCWGLNEYGQLGYPP